MLKLPSELKTTQKRKSSLPDPDLQLEGYKLLGRLGRGGFSDVYVVRRRTTGKLFALKVISKKIAANWKGELVRREFEILRDTRHPLIVQLDCAFTVQDGYIFVMDYCPGGTVFEALKRAGRFEEDRALIYIAEMLLVINYLHENEIIYRDVKAS